MAPGSIRTDRTRRHLDQPRDASGSGVGHTGAGNFAGFIGEQQQTVLGFNATGGVNLRVTFVLWKVVR